MAPVDPPVAIEPFYVHCGKCGHEWAAGFVPCELSVAAHAMKAPCPVCRSKKVFLGKKPKTSAVGDYMAWLDNGDTGISSETIWSVMTGRRVPKSRWHAGHPHDPSDFGRCYRLLKIMPAWRERLPEVATKYPDWAGLVSAWDELTALYEEELPTGMCRKLYDRMQELGA